MAATVTVEQLSKMQEKSNERIETLAKSIEGLTKAMSRTPAPGTPSPEQVFGLPNARRGEDAMSSRGLSFMKMIGLCAGQINPDECKVEIDVHRRLNQAYVKELGGDGYQYRSGRRPGDGAFLMPIATSFMQEPVINRAFRVEMKQLVRAGVDGADPDEVAWINRKRMKTLSWIDETSGGALVAPPEFGEIIELLRAKEACVQAGARVVPLPPQGRMKFPRQTAASLHYWIGENQQITDSNIGTGEINLQAKKLAVLIKAPNELIRFASPSAEALMRDDMTKTLALGLDQACLEGTGGDNKPRGLLNYPDVYRLTSSDPHTDGDRLVGEDVYRFITAVEEANAEFEGFVMRPKTWFKYHQLRVDAVTQGDKAGMFLFSLIRDQGDGMPKPSLAGYPVTKSTLVSQARSKGAKSNLTYIAAGQWSEMLIGMFGAVEFAATNVGDTPFQFDQTWVRGILSADVALRHEASFVVMDQLDLTL
jgi:HK97 family phage major capsid protein